MDPAHPRHEPGHRYRDVIRSYYAYLDDEIGELLERFDDDTAVLVVSDHGARPMEGAICVNEWLRKRATSCSASYPTARSRSATLPSTGAAPRLGRGRLLLPAVPERRGREPQGVVDPADYDALRDELARAPRGAARPRRPPDRHARVSPRGALARPARDPARPRRLLRRPRLAQQRERRPRPPLDVRQRHRPRRRQPRP